MKAPDFQNVQINELLLITYQSKSKACNTRMVSPRLQGSSMNDDDLHDVDGDARDCIPRTYKSQNWSKFAKFGQHFAFSMLKSTPARKKYTTAGCGGCDKYELWSYLVWKALPRPPHCGEHLRETPEREKNLSRVRFSVKNRHQLLHATTIITNTSSVISTMNNHGHFR